MILLSRKIVNTIFAVAILSLAACGGGGSSDVVVSKPGQSLYSSAPTNLSLKIGDTSSYKIGGGGNGSAFTSYTVSVSNPNVLSVTSKDTEFQVTALSDGSANVTIQDSAGGSIVVKVTVDGSSPLKVLAPGTISFKPGFSDAYQISGGSAPYSVTSSNQGVAKVSISGSSITVNAVSTGGAQVFVFDKKGNSSSIVVNVKDDNVSEIPLFTTSPSFVNMNIDGALQVFKIGGGKAPYNVTTSAPNVIDVSKLDNSFTITPKKLGFGVVYITDSTGTSVSLQIIVNSGKDSVPFYTSASTTISVNISGSSTFELFGGKAPYTVTSSNSSVATVDLIGSKFTITAKEKGTSSIVAKDSIGAVVTIALTVPDNQVPVNTIPLFSTAPGSIVIQPGVTSSFSIFGGTTPYQVSSSNTSVVTASSSGNTLSITGNQVGTSTVLVKDATGTTINVAVTVPSSTSDQVSSALFTTAPPAVVLKVGAPETFSVLGGKAPYVATSSDTSVLQVSTSNDGKFTLTGVSAGNVNVVILDSNGTSVTLAATTKNQVPANSTPLFSTAPGSIVLQAGVTSSFSIFGGTTPYQVSSSNASVATASSNGNTLSITGNQVGASTVLIKDATGTTINVAVTVPQVLPVLFTTAPSSIVVKVGAPETYSVFGGKAPYVATSSDTSVLQVSTSNDGKFTLTGVSVGKVNVVIFDSNGSSVTLSVTTKL